MTSIHEMSVGAKDCNARFRDVRGDVQSKGILPETGLAAKRRPYTFVTNMELFFCSRSKILEFCVDFSNMKHHMCSRVGVFVGRLMMLEVQTVDLFLEGRFVNLPR